MPYLTAAEAQERSGVLASAESAAVERLIAEFEEIAEDYRGVAYIPRTATETIVVPHDGVLMLRWPKVRSVDTLTSDGVEIAADDFTVDLSTGTVYYWGGYRGFRSTVVVYEHGFDTPPALLRRACVEYVSRSYSSDISGTSRDIIGQAFEGGFTRYSTPDKAAGRPTGFLEVDRLLNSLPDYRSPGVA